MPTEHVPLSILAEHLTGQLLAGTPASDPVAVAKRLLAIQAQDGRAARLAIRARSTGLTAADVDRAFSHDRTLVVTWLNRGTLHLVRSEDYAWLHALTAPPLRAANARRLSQEGVPPDAAERGVAVIKRALGEEGPLGQDQLRERVAALGVRTQGQAFVHLLALASIRGLIVRGPVIDRKQAIALTHDWVGEQAPVDRDRALAELARRYLIGHGPAEDDDLARWSGLPVRDVRTGLAAIASELADRQDGRLAVRRRPALAAMPGPRLLGAFEPLLLGWSAEAGRHRRRDEPGVRQPPEAPTSGHGEERSKPRYRGCVQALTASAQGAHALAAFAFEGSTRLPERASSRWARRGGPP